MIALWVLFFVAASLLGHRASRALPLVRFYWPTLIFKLIAGLAVGGLYASNGYIGDTFNYFHDVQQLALLGASDKAGVGFLWNSWALGQVPETEAPLFYLANQPRAWLMVRLLYPLYWVSGGSYWLLSLWCSLVSFLGLWHLANRIARVAPQLKLAAVISCLAWPSFVFWSAGVLKEAFALPLMALLLAWLLPALVQGKAPRLHGWLWSPPLIVLLFLLKYYYAALLLPFLAVTAIVRVVAYRQEKAGRPMPLGGQLLAMGLGLAVLLVAASWLHPNLQFNYVAQALVRNHNINARASAPEDMAHYHGLAPTVIGIGSNMPKALFTGLFGPMPWRASNGLQWLAAIENAVLLLLTLLALPRLARVPWRKEGLLWVAGIAYCLTLGAAMAMAAPSYGTLVRYKAGFLFIWVLGLLALLEPVKTGISIFPRVRRTSGKKSTKK